MNSLIRMLVLLVALTSGGCASYITTTEQVTGAENFAAVTSITWPDGKPPQVEATAILSALNDGLSTYKNYFGEVPEIARVELCLRQTFGGVPNCHPAEGIHGPFGQPRPCQLHRISYEIEDSSEGTVIRLALSQGPPLSGWITALREAAPGFDRDTDSWHWNWVQTVSRFSAYTDFLRTPRKTRLDN